MHNHIMLRGHTARGPAFHTVSHTQLVSEAAELLIGKLDTLGVAIDAEFIRIAVVLHDVGKIVHPAELDRPGTEHEPAGEQLLLSKGINSKLARCCLSHARWASMACSLEELVIALADTLWKAKRLAALETAVVKAVSERAKQDYWDLFIDLYTCFEDIAAGGAERLVRSQLS
jgi:HD superfamily phosphodiesterase